MSYLRIAPNPPTHIGWGALDQLVSEIKHHGAGRSLLIADPALKKTGLTGRVAGLMEEEGLGYDLYSDIIPEPTLETGEKLVRFAREGNYSLVIGIGGGSALDLAKLAAVLVDNEGSLEEYLNLTGTKKIQAKGLPKILIPTTSGTGTEVTNISVLALGHTKDTIIHDHLLADTAIVDPQLTVTVPPRVTAATGADALTHAIEAFISVNANPFSDGLALQAIRLIGQSLERAVSDGNDQDARISMSYGSYLAGLSFFNAGVGAVHALAYPLGGRFHLPHGESNAVLIPYVMDYIRPTCFRKMAIILGALGEDTSGLSAAEAAVKCVNRLAALIKAIGIPPTLDGFDIPETAVKQLSEDGILQKRLLARCPMVLTQEDIFKIYQSAFHEYPFD